MIPAVIPLTAIKSATLFPTAQKETMNPNVVWTVILMEMLTTVAIGDPRHPRHHLTDTVGDYQTAKASQVFFQN